jgi:hypothetical protein
MPEVKWDGTHISIRAPEQCWELVARYHGIIVEDEWPVHITIWKRAGGERSGRRNRDGNTCAGRGGGVHVELELIGVRSMAEIKTMLIPVRPPIWLKRELVGTSSSHRLD